MKEQSYITVIPAREEDITPGAIMERLSATGGRIRSGGVKFETYDERDFLRVLIYVDEREYDIFLTVLEYEIPDFFRTEHFFSDLDFEKISQIHYGLEVTMEYTEDFMTCYHDQLRIMDYLVPEQLAAIDIPSEKIISGKWVKLAAESEVPPSPKYLFTVQAIADDGDEVWLHTHGLKRCGLPDLEILGSTRDSYENHYNIIESMAKRLLDGDSDLQPYEPVFLARMTEEIPMVATIVDWKEALPFYPDVKMGTAEDRDEYHSEGTSVIMVYKSQSDCDNKKVSPVQIMDPYFDGNPMFMISTPETNRMRALAQERIDYVKAAVWSEDPDTGILMKIGLTLDEEFRNPNEDLSTQREHIWFEVKAVERTDEGDVFVCELTQEPYYVKAMTVGSIGRYTVEDVTDWLIFADGRRYSPDDAYLMK